MKVLLSRLFIFTLLALLSPNLSSSSEAVCPISVSYFGYDGWPWQNHQSHSNAPSSRLTPFIQALLEKGYTLTPPKPGAYYLQYEIIYNRIARLHLMQYRNSVDYLKPILNCAFKIDDSLFNPQAPTPRLLALTQSELFPNCSDLTQRKSLPQNQSTQGPLANMSCSFSNKGNQQ